MPNGALWAFLFDIDLVATMRVERRSPADGLPWMLTNLRAAVPTDVGDGLWLKLLDIPAALEARRSSMRIARRRAHRP